MEIPDRRHPVAQPVDKTRMFTITKAAAAYLAKKLEEDGAGEVVRFVFGLSGLEPQPSVVLPGDATFEFEGKTILAIDQTMSHTESV